MCLHLGDGVRLTASLIYSQSGDSSGDLSRILLSRDLLPGGATSPMLLRVHQLLSQVVEFHSPLQARVLALDNLVNEQLREINRMKQELSLVCTGQSKSAFQQVNPLVSMNTYTIIALRAKIDKLL